MNEENKPGQQQPQSPNQKQVQLPVQQGGQSPNQQETQPLVQQGGQSPNQLQAQAPVQQPAQASVEQQVQAPELQQVQAPELQQVQAPALQQAQEIDQQQAVAPILEQGPPGPPEGRARDNSPNARPPADDVPVHPWVQNMLNIAEQRFIGHISHQAGDIDDESERPGPDQPEQPPAKSSRDPLNKAKPKPRKPPQ